MEERDLVVIGGGPAGYVAAIRACQLGGKVTLIEKDAIGGTCLNRGCIPTRALARGVELLDLAKKAKDYGVNFGEASVDFAKMMARKDIVVKTLVGGVDLLLKGNGVEVVKGRGKLLSGSEIEVELEGGEKKVIKARGIIIATGSGTRRLSVPGGKGKGIIDSKEALELSEVPKSMVILGGQEIGFAFATIFSRLGTRVTVLEDTPEILTSVDREVVSTFERGLKKDGIQVFSEATINKIEDGESGDKNVSVDLKEGQVILACQYVLVADNREVNTAELGLEQAGVELNEKGILANRRMETNVPGVFAAGDATGREMLASVAFVEGKTAAENGLGRDTEMDYRVIPKFINTIPQIASVGLTENEARAEGYQLKVGSFPFAASGMAAILGERTGLIKIVTDTRYGQILGVHSVGPRAADLITEAALVMKMEGTAQEISSTIHPHPTLAEAFMEAALDVSGETIHFLSPK